MHIWLEGNKMNPKQIQKLWRFHSLTTPYPTSKIQKQLRWLVGIIATLCVHKTHRPDTIDDDVANFKPAFQREDLKQRLHGIADVVKVKVARIRPKHMAQSSTNNEYWIALKKM